MLSKKFLTAIMATLLPCVLLSQSYFQQKTDYYINVDLDVQTRVLKGSLTLTYQNNSQDTLDKMIFHLWPNAYSTKNSNFSLQLLEMNNPCFYFAPDSIMGGIDSLRFLINGDQQQWEYYEGNVDIAIVRLNQPVDPGRTVELHIPFRIKIPYVFSRLGVENETFNISQWYPKPAVYDHNGWNPLSYLDIGEFYSEFGDYKVDLTLPSNYFVASTGVLQTETEKDRVNGRIEMSGKLLEGKITDDQWDEMTDKSEIESKTIRFKAENVHDFAWFADPSFVIEEEDLDIDKDGKIKAYSYYPPEERDLWKGSIQYVKDATYFYSTQVGAYPYPQVTIVNGSLSAGGGMEYPMVTVIDDVSGPMSLDGIIAHEIGHNWFYSALGSNERMYPWMDEGINTFYELKYLQFKYPDLDPYAEIVPGIISEDDLETISSHYFYLLQARRTYEQKTGMESESYTPNNYFLAVYQKPALAFAHLEAYLGEENFKVIMQEYFRNWSGKHPQPGDLRNIFEQATNKDLNWFFDDLLHSSKKLDYEIKNIRNSNDSVRIILNNKGSIAAPVPLSSLKESRQTSKIWIDGFEGSKTITLEKTDVDAFLLDPNFKTIDIQRKNNFYRHGGIFPRSKSLKFASWMPSEHSREYRINIFPVIGGNAYDKFQLGLWIYNPIFPENNFHFSLLPMYAFGSGEITGIGHLQYSLFPESNWLRRLKLALDTKSFHKDKRNDPGYDLRYSKWMPSLGLDFYNHPKKYISQKLEYKAIFLNEDFIRFADQDSFNIIQENQLIHQLEYALSDQNGINPWSLGLKLEYQEYDSFNGESQNYLKASGIFRSRIMYKCNRSIDIRFFGAFFPVNSQRQSASFDKEITRGSIALLHQGFNDYAFEDYYFGRSDQTGLWSRQIDSHREGGFKNALSSAYSIGLTNDFALSLNLKMELPFSNALFNYIKPYLDLGLYNQKATTLEDYETEFLYSGGVLVELPGDIISIHLPLFYSGKIKSAYYDLGGLGSRISFYLNLNRVNPYRILEEIH